MSYDHKPVNPNRGGVSRSGFTTDSRMADMDPAFDMPWWAWALIPVVLVGFWIIGDKL